jgi:hypothetical protein
MTMGGNTMIPGATTLAFLNLAEVQGDMAQMERDNLSLFSGTTGPDGTSTAGFFAVEQMANTTSISQAGQVADEQVSQGWVQFGEGMGSALTQGLGVAAGYFGTKGLSNEADELEGTLTTNQNSGMRATVTDETEMQNMASVEGSNPAPVAGETPAVAEDLAEASAAKKQTTSDDEIKRSVEAKRTQVANLQTRYTTIGAAANAVVTGSFNAGSGYMTANITKAQGLQTYLQATPGIVQQAAGVATAAIAQELSAEQAAASAFQGVVSLTGAVRG